MKKKMTTQDEVLGEVEHYDLEVLVEGRRELFPLLPGVQCPTGHTCRVRNSPTGITPMMGSLKNNLKAPLAMSLNWGEFNNNMNTVCKGDSVKWINNKGGPHNVVFDEDAIPKGVDQEKISMDEQLGEEGETFVMKFDEPGSYDFYCEPHRGAGMNGLLTVV